MMEWTEDVAMSYYVNKNGIECLITQYEDQRMDGHEIVEWSGWKLYMARPLIMAYGVSEARIVSSVNTATTGDSFVPMTLSLELIFEDLGKAKAKAEELLPLFESVG